MGSFAFIVHPIEVADVARKFPVAKYLPQKREAALVPPFEAFRDHRGQISNTGPLPDGLYRVRLLLHDATLCPKMWL